MSTSSTFSEMAKEDQIFGARLGGTVRKVFSVLTCWTCGQRGVYLNIKHFFSENQSNYSYIYLVRRKDDFSPPRAGDLIAGITLVSNQQPWYCFLLVDRAYEQTISILLNKYNFLLEDLSNGLCGSVSLNKLTI